jgi:hypothetical protein
MVFATAATCFIGHPIKQRNRVKFIEIDSVFFLKKKEIFRGKFSVVRVPLDSEIQRGCLFLKIRRVMRRGGGREGGGEGGREGGMREGGR